MSHENTITVQHKNGRWYNLKTVKDGYQMTDRAAEKEWMPVGESHETSKKAVKAAKKRSKSFDKEADKE